MNFLSRFRKKESEPHCSVVIVAAGSSVRMGSDKIMLKIGELPVIVRTARVFQNSPLVDEIIIVTRQDNIMTIAALREEYGLSKVCKIICGGETRAASCLAGVSEVSKDAKLIAIHDGARPFVSEEVIARAVYAAAKYRAAVPAIACTDTLKIVDDGIVTGTLDRSRVMRLQTPQVFDADMIKGALTKAVTASIPVTDDSSAVEMMGIKTHIVEGDEDNIKLTTQKDMIIAEAILRQRGEFK